MVLIGCGKRIDSVQPGENGILVSRKRKKKCCTPFVCLGGPNGSTEREQKTDYLMMDTTENGCGHQFLPWHVQNIPFVPIRLARPRVLHGPKRIFLDRNGTNDHGQPRSVPIVLMLLVGS